MTKLSKFYKSLIALILGHFTVFKHSFKKRVTLEYPEIKPILNDRFRGKHSLDCSKCTGCGICKRTCPCGAIEIIFDKDENDKKFMKDFQIDLSKCIFCGNCQYYCPSNAMKLTKKFELASAEKSSLILDINALKIKSDSNIIENEES